jgi:hypothetical protein
MSALGAFSQIAIIKFFSDSWLRKSVFISLVSGDAQRIDENLVNCKALIAIIFHYLHFPIFYKGCSAGNLEFPNGKSAGNPVALP